MNKYEKLEDDLVKAFLVQVDENTYINKQLFDISPLPDNEKEFVPSNPRPQVYCTYESSDFSDPETLSWVVQDEKVKFSFEIHSRTRRGDKGVYAIFETIKNKILGLKFLGYDKMALIQSTPLIGSGANHWVFYAQFSTNTKISDIQKDPDSEGNLLKNAEFIYS